MEATEKSNVRKSDLFDGAYSRTGDRVFCRGDQWYLRTRENDRGPFGTRAEAVEELKRYIDTMEFLEENELPADVDPGDVTLVEFETPKF
jgi:hypothetical protein